MRPLKGSGVERVYFAVQRLRGGVRPEMIRQAARWLAAPWAESKERVLERLAAVHGATRDPLGWLSQQPLIDRTSLGHLAAEGKRRRGVEYRHTSGSTGAPFHFVKDKEMTAWMDAVMWAAYQWHGVGLGDREARFWGTPLSGTGRFKRRIMDWWLARRRLGAFDMSPAQSETFFHELRRFRPVYAYGYPSLMQEFVRHCSSAGIEGGELRLNVVISTGELLTPNVRRCLHEFFNCPVIDEYGCTESGIIAMECERGTLHQLPIAALSEIVQGTGQRVTAGNEGEVVVTDLFGHTAPFLRYRLHDRATWEGLRPCECGRELPALHVDVGRLDSFIETPDGKRIYDAVLAYAAPAGVMRFRAFQRAVDLLEVFIVPDHGTSARELGELCRRRWGEALGPSMRIRISIVDSLSYEDSGKLRYFVPMHLQQAGDATVRDGSTTS